MNNLFLMSWSSWITFSNTLLITLLTLLKRARYSALRERSIGIGALGFHALFTVKTDSY